MIYSRLARPFDAVRSLRGLTVTDELKVLLSLMVGYLATTIYKVLKSAKPSIEKRFGGSRTDFITKQTNLKYILNITSDGFYFVIRPRIYDYEMTSLQYEPEVKRVFRPKQGEVIIDVGSCIGAYTIRPSRIVGKDGLVVALEPDPENFKLLSMNIRLNELSNVIALPAAAYENDGTHLLYIKGVGEHSLHKAHVIKIHGKSNGEIKVSTITLDTLIKKLNLKRVDWAKIDVEGAELSVLKGASNALEIVRKLIVEVWNETANEVLSILQQRRYKTTVLCKYGWGMYILAEKQA